MARAVNEQFSSDIFSWFSFTPPKEALYIDDLENIEDQAVNNDDCDDGTSNMMVDSPKSESKLNQVQLTYQFDRGKAQGSRSRR